MARRKTQKRDAQTEQVEMILEQLAKGVAPWAKPWQSLGGQRNARTGRFYNGGNALYLSAVADANGYSVPLWVTSKQAQALGGRVKGRVQSWDKAKGELVETQECQYDKSWLVQWFRPDEKAKTDADGKPVLNSDGDPETVTYWRKGVQFVYNVEQTTAPARKYAKLLPEMRDEHERNTEVESFLTATHHGAGFGLNFGGDRAFYRVSADKVTVPKAKSFKQVEEFYATQLHEFAHASGHKSRLARGLANVFGSEAYAEEELVAELTAAFLGAEFQIDGKCQHVEYLGSWYKRLEEDQRLFYRAASKAKKAAAYLKKAAEKGAKTVEQVEEKAAA